MADVGYFEFYHGANVIGILSPGYERHIASFSFLSRFVFCWICLSGLYVGGVGLGYLFICMVWSNDVQSGGFCLRLFCALSESDGLF